MPIASLIQGDQHIAGNLTVSGSKPALTRAELAQESNAAYTMRPEDWRVFDDIRATLPNAAANDDLGIIQGTFGSATPSIQAGDLKAAGATTRRARRTFMLPPEYEAGQSVTIRAHAGVLTTIADTSCTIDFEVYKSDEEAGVSSDLVTTAATSINSTTLEDKDFAVNAISLSPGDTLDIRMSITCTDGATATAVTPIVGASKLLLDVKG